MLSVSLPFLYRDMERQPQASDARLVRAARSLHVNQQTKEIAEARIERASKAITAGASPDLPLPGSPAPSVMLT